MTDVTDAAWLWVAKGAGAVAGSAMSLAYILPHGRREAAIRFAVGVACGLVFGGTAGLKIAAELDIGKSIGSGELVLMGSAAASLCAWWVLGILVRAFERHGLPRAEALMRTLFIDPGSLRSEMVLEACTISPDTIGGHAETWTEQATVFALIEPVSATSVFGADQTIETVTHRMTMRWRADVASGMRFVRQGRILEIVTVHDPDETGRYLVCRTREKGL